MDPWNSCQTVFTVSEISAKLKFEDNFQPTIIDKLPDSEQYLAVLEEKLDKLKSDPNVLRQLKEKRESCMQNLLSGDVQFEDENIKLDAPVANSQLLRTILPQKQALNQGEIVELVKYDQLSNEDSDIEVNKDSEENRST